MWLSCIQQHLHPAVKVWPPISHDRKITSKANLPCMVISRQPVARLYRRAILGHDFVSKPLFGVLLGFFKNQPADAARNKITDILPPLRLTRNGTPINSIFFHDITINTISIPYRLKYTPKRLGMSSAAHRAGQGTPLPVERGCPIVPLFGAFCPGGTIWDCPPFVPFCPLCLCTVLIIFYTLLRIIHADERTLSLTTQPCSR